MNRVACCLVCAVLPPLFARPAAAELVEMTVVNPAGWVNPIELGIDDGGGFVFTTLTDDDGDGRIEALLPFDGMWALRIDPPPGSTGEDIWGFQGSGVSPAHALPFEIPVFGNLAGGPLGVDLGTVTPPDVDFMPGDVFSVNNGLLPSWPEVRFIDTTGVPTLPDFVAAADSLPSFNGNVFVSDITLEFAPVPAPSVLAVLAVGLLTRSRRRTAVERG